MSGDWGGERHGAGRGQLTTSLNSDSDNENDSESDSERLSPSDAGIYCWLDLVIIVLLALSVPGSAWPPFKL